MTCRPTKPFLRSLQLIFCLLLGASTFINANEFINYSTYLATNGDYNIPLVDKQKHFDCSENIYIVIEVSKQTSKTPSQHKFVVNWINPGGGLEQTTKQDFTSYGVGTRLWAWLRLTPPSGVSLSKIFDPAFGMGAFIGQWLAKISIDGVDVENHEFDVLC